MEFVSNISTSNNLQQILQDLTKDATGNYDLGILFISPQTGVNIQSIVEGLKKILPIKSFIGCTCAGIIGTHDEIEYQPAASLILGRLPGVRLTPFVVDQAELETFKDPKQWYEFLEIFPNEHPVFIMLPDPFQFDMDRFLKEINKAYPKCPVIGGLASGAHQPNENTLILNDEYFEQGVVGVILTGNVRVSTVVSQGCKPIGENFIITKSDGNIIYELAGKPLLEVLEEVLDKASIQDQKLAQEAIFVGIAMNEYKDAYKRGDFLVRGLMRIDQNTGAGAISDYIKTGQTVQFHVRDAQTATEDLKELLDKQKPSPGKPKGALVFSCNGRGQYLFKEKNHDIAIIQNSIGPIPAAGFFCAGEIGPVGDSNFLHGFTDSIALFYPASES